VAHGVRGKERCGGVWGIMEVYGGVGLHGER